MRQSGIMIFMALHVTHWSWDKLSCMCTWGHVSARFNIHVQRGDKHAELSIIRPQSLHWYLTYYSVLLRRSQ